ncbi:hypothetical protein KAR91_30735 [Candidatus Pacearchaeota archaeon]|nr:hypothetical protein [Candidatus Pacearchaeota archaeon]
MSANDRVQDGITARSVKLGRSEEDLVKKILVILLDLRKTIKKELALTHIDEAISKRIRKSRLESLVKEVNLRIGEKYALIADQTQDFTSKIADSEAKSTIKIVNEAFKFPLLDKVLSNKQLESLAKGVFIEGTLVADWINAPNKSNVNSLVKKHKAGFERLIQKNMLLGNPLVDYQKDLVKLTGIANKDAEALVRTAVQTTANQAKIETLEANKDVLHGLEWVSTLDKRTTDICISLDGAKWYYTKDGLKPVGHNKRFPGPTAHWRCRSTQALITKSFAEMAGVTKKRLEGMPKETRASLGGQVSSKVTYPDWLKGKSDKTQIDILGKKKAEMFKKGELDLRHLTDFRNRPLTIEELNK